MASNTLAAHIMSGNFATDRVTTPNNEANSINSSAFLPQRNVWMVKQEHIWDVITKTKRVWMFLT
jgi:hypothetical protein